MALLSRFRTTFFAVALLGGMSMAVLDCAGRNGASSPTPSPLSKLPDASPSSATNGTQPTTPGVRHVSARLNRPMRGFPNVFSPDGRVAGRLDDQCMLWDTQNGLYRGVFDRSVCTGYQEEAARIHDAKQIDACKAQTNPCKGAKAIVVSPKKDEVAVYFGNPEAPLTILDASGKQKRTVALSPENRGTGCSRLHLAWNPENLVVLCQGEQNSWDGQIGRYPNGLAPKTAMVESMFQVNVIELDPFGWFAAVNQVFQQPGGQFNGQQVKPLASAIDATALPVGVPDEATRANSEKDDVLPPARSTFSADGRVLGLWSGVVVTRTPKIAFETVKSYVGQAAAVAPDGSRVAYLQVEDNGPESRTNRVLLLHKPGDPNTKTTHLPDGNVVALEWSADARHLALRSSARLEVRSGETGAVELFWARVAHMVWGAEGTLAVEQEGRVQMRDLATRAELFRLPAGQKLVGRALAGEVLVTVGGSKMTTWNATSGKKGIEIPGAATNLALSSDGKLVASGTTLSNVIVSETDTGKKVTSFTAPEITAKEKRLTDIAFINGGKEVAALDGEGHAVIWDRSTGAARVLPRRIGAVSAIAPSGDLYVDTHGDVVRIKDEVSARVNELGAAVDGGCITEAPLPDVKDAGAKASKPRAEGLAREMVLAFGDARSGAVAGGTLVKEGLSHEQCASAFFAGSALPLPPVLLRDPVAPPVLRLAEATYDAGIATMPIHVIDQGGGATSVKIDRRSSNVITDAGSEITQWSIPAGGTPAGGKAYTWIVSRDAGSNSSYVTTTACNAVDGGLCSESTKEVYLTTK